MFYDSVYLRIKEENKQFSSGNFVKDWYDAMKYFINSEFEEHLSFSSTVDHFISDGAPYDSAYLKFKDDKPYLTNRYDDENIGIEFFIPENTTPTWEEFKKLCEV